MRESVIEFCTELNEIDHKQVPILKNQLQLHRCAHGAEQYAKVYSLQMSLSSVI